MISEVISKKVSLKHRAPGEFLGLCPFHSEKTPSMHFDGKKGLFYCFGCKEGGNAIQFVCKIDNLKFKMCTLMALS
jgi:DNA primase